MVDPQSNPIDPPAERSSPGWALVDGVKRSVGEPVGVSLSGEMSVLWISARWIVASSLGLMIALAAVASPAYAGEMIEGDGYSLKVPAGRLSVLHRRRLRHLTLSEHQDDGRSVRRRYA